MATVKKGTLVCSPEWWKHLRPFNKRKVWNKEKAAWKREVGKILNEAQ